jgi:hypothetical protein
MAMKRPPKLSNNIIVPMKYGLLLSDIIAASRGPRTMGPIALAGAPAIAGRLIFYLFHSFPF